jgi:hypothetical protein
LIKKGIYRIRNWWIDNEVLLIGLAVLAVLIALTIVLNVVSPIGTFQGYHEEAIAECIAYNLNHTNSSCWV